MTPRPYQQSGLTLVELMVTIAVLGILLGIGVPGFQSMLAQNRASSTANDLLATLQFARSTAIAQARPVSVCPVTARPVTACSANTNWQGGWVVWMDGQVVREHPALGPAMALTGRGQWTYTGAGTLSGQDMVHFDLTVTSAPGAARRICMTMSGSSRIITPGGETSC